MPSITFGMILTYANYAMIKSHEIRDLRLKKVVMDQFEGPGKSLTVGNTGPPYTETRTSLSQPANSAKELE
ncbi:hypothetical protein CR513_31622, partial [Mucuna pruriens]